MRKHINKLLALLLIAPCLLLVTACFGGGDPLKKMSSAELRAFALTALENTEKQMTEGYVTGVKMSTRELYTPDLELYREEDAWFEFNASREVIAYRSDERYWNEEQFLWDVRHYLWLEDTMYFMQAVHDPDIDSSYWNEKYFSPRSTTNAVKGDVLTEFIETRFALSSFTSLLNNNNSKIVYKNKTIELDCPSGMLAYTITIKNGLIVFIKETTIEEGVETAFQTLEFFYTSNPFPANTFAVAPDVEWTLS